jgi:cyclohexyl-isocyanide hydratase
MRIGLFIFPRMTQLDATGPYEVFARIPGATVDLVAASSAPVSTEWGMRIAPTVTMADAPALDLLCVPGGSGINALLGDLAVLDFVARQGEHAAYVTSVCTGSLVLGAAGLLEGYRATTHWLSLDLLPIFGAIPVSERVVVDRNRITGGGITAGIDFGLTIAAHVAGTDAANEIQLMMEYDPAPPSASGSPAVAEPALVERVRAQRSGFQAERRALAEAAAKRLRTK